jgi:hypothetical protein
MERGDGGMASRGGVVGSAAMLGLDMHLAPQQIQPVAFQQQQQSGGGGFQLQQPAPVRQQPPSFSPYSASSNRVVTAAASHDEEMAGNSCKGGAAQQQAGTAGCPWTRMKWTDAMVRLLVRVVYSVGDDGEGLPSAGGGAGGKATHAASQQQQKKGKWKSVSRAMMDNGFRVSPQQCEDKFNDLNKRYKRVVDLLGRGRACRVVENHALLDAIDDLAPKAKDEARKLLSSKHLFFREMCAYHNSGAPHGAGAPPSHLPPNHDAAAAACLHHPPPAPMAAAASSAARQAHPFPPGTKDSWADDSEDDGVSNNQDDDVEDDYDEEDDVHMYPSHNQRLHQRRHHHSRKRGRGAGADDSAAGEDDEAGGRGAQSAAVQQLQSELASATAADPQAAKGWMRRRAVEVEEQQASLDWRAHQLEQQRLKWERFRANKERDMERARLRNQRLRLDGQRMLLMLRHRDIDLDMTEANSSSVDHHPGQGLLAAHLGSSPSTAGHPN